MIRVGDRESRGLKIKKEAALTLSPRVIAAVVVAPGGQGPPHRGL